eukprot:TRINITY_DN1896_c0_g1_i1.p1 TRINITY_DN1896_c0_g1~~TRINITY_DN1896_c0_g1_i1.p1  ORF type:complete len:696 (+),score=175.72 TRINITY_DN1896_c0_g1_i1:70-2157(+)
MAENSSRRAQRIVGHLCPVQRQIEEVDRLVHVHERSADEITTQDAAGFLSSLPIPIGSVVNTERNGGELVAQTLKDHGVRFIFTLVGGHISPILVESKRKGIRIIDVRHEATTVFAADAVARLTGVPGVAAVTAGPGITNTITAVKNAQMAQSPLVLIGGAAATLLKGRGSLQDIDQLVLLKPIVKYAATVTRVKDIVPTLRKAFQIAVSGVPGPVFVEFPLDVLYSIGEVKASMGLARRKRCKELKKEDIKHVIIPEEAKGLTQEQYIIRKDPESPVFLEPDQSKNPKVVEMFMKYKLATLFAGAWEPTESGPLPTSVPMPAVTDVKRVAQLLKAATRPVILIGSQATLSAQRIEALHNAVTSFGVPVFLGGMARGLMGRNHPYHIRQNRAVALKKADLVILAGTICDFRLDYGRAFSKTSTIVAVNRSQKDLTLNADLFWKPSIALLADPGSFLVQLAVLHKAPLSKHVEWTAELKNAEKAKEDANLQKASAVSIGRGDQQGRQLINPLQLCATLEEVMSKDSIIVADGGDFVATMSYIIRPRGPLTWLDPGAFGTLGVGAGFALGAKLCRPEAEVWLIWGDGSAGYSLIEYDTFVRHGVPVISLIGNDACWTQIEREQVPMFKDDVACPLVYTEYDKAAEGIGAKGISIATPDKDSIANALTHAAQLAANGQPVVINALIGRTDFRDGSLSV